MAVDGLDGTELGAIIQPPGAIPSGRDRCERVVVVVAVPVTADALFRLQLLLRRSCSLRACRTVEPGTVVAETNPASPEAS